MEEILKNLKIQIETCRENGEEMDSKSFSYEEGVLITANEAQLIIDEIEAAHGESSDENSGLHIAVVNERTLGINSCAALIKSMPTDQAIQIMKSDITGQPQTSVIDGQLVVAYVR